MHEKGVDLDRNVEGNDNNFAQIDDSLEWGYAMHPPNVPSPLYDAFYQAEGAKRGTAHTVFPNFWVLGQQVQKRPEAVQQ